MVPETAHRFARKAGGGTDWGAKLDPLADKILLSAPMIWLAAQGIFPVWSVWLFLAREILVSGWRSNAIKGGPASLAGKTKTTLLFLSVLLLLCPINWNQELSIYIQGIGLFTYWVSLSLAISSATGYFKPLLRTDLD